MTVRQYIVENWKAISLVVGIVVLAVIAAIAIFTTHETQVRVAGHDWWREIQVEDYQSRQYEGWDETVPNDARDVTCWRAQRGSHQQYTGQTCTGTGTRRTCHSNYITVPDYDDKCSYTADRWAYVRSLNSEGHSRSERPYWLELDFTPCPELGCEREGQHIETYRVRFQEGENLFDCPVTEAMWSEYRVGDTYSMQIGTFIHVPRCETIGRPS